MASKIYYGIGFLVLLIYSVATIKPFFYGKPALPTFSFGLKRMNKGKYVPYTPSKSSSDPDYSGGGSRRSSSYPTGGGYSGGK